MLKDLCFRSDLNLLMGRLDELIEEGLAEGWAFGAFGVPLDGEAEVGVGIVDGFDDLVVGGGEGLVAARIRDDLFVIRHH